MATEKPMPEAEGQKCTSCSLLEKHSCPTSCIFRHFLWPCTEENMKVAKNLHKYFAAENITQLVTERINFSDEQRIKFVGNLIETSNDFEKDKIDGPYSKIKLAEAHGGDDGDDSGDVRTIDGTGGDVAGDGGAPAGSGDVAPPPTVADTSSAHVVLPKLTVRKSTGGKAPRRQLVTEVDALAPAPGGYGDGNEPVPPVLAPDDSGDSNEPVPPPAEGGLIADIDASGLLAP